MDLLRVAQQQGYRTYLYFIATEDPEINVQRVTNRVAQGGHSVPVNKIIERYHRALQLLREAIRYTNRAYFFDTSESESWFFAEITNGTELSLKSEEFPDWFVPVWNEIA